MQEGERLAWTRDGGTEKARVMKGGKITSREREGKERRLRVRMRGRGDKG